MPDSIRKVGKRKTDLSGESDAEVLKKAKQLIRTDFGGSSNPLEVIQKKMKEEGVDAGEAACKAIKKLLEEQVESCRRRTTPRLDEAIRRAEGRRIVESLP
jgi:hypothetical protein